MHSIAYDQETISFSTNDVEYIEDAQKLNDGIKIIRSLLDNAMNDGKYSHGFAIDLCIDAFLRSNNPDAIIEEIKKLEGIDITLSRTKEAKKLHGPLKGLWHKHYFQARWLVRNICEELEKMKKDGRFRAMLAPFVGKMPEDCISELSSTLIDRPYMDRKIKSKLTGEFFVFEKDNYGKNYYLCLGQHGRYDEIREKVDMYKLIDGETGTLTYPKT